MVIRNQEQSPAAQALPLLKVPAGGRVAVNIQSDCFTAFSVHWIGRQFLCPVIDCPACELYPRRLKLYAVATDVCPDQVKAVLLELPEATAFSIGEQAKAMEFGERTTASVLLSRRKKNSPLRAEVLCRVKNRFAWLEGERMTIAAVSILHALVPPAQDETLAEWEHRTRTSARLKLARAIAES